ncbi:MAG: type II toxin-antitoxin system HicA family toxin [Elusimicrobiota bacterium]
MRALKRAGFALRHEGKHTSMARGDRVVIVPRHPRIKRETLRGIIDDAGLTVEEFRDCL